MGEGREVRERVGEKRTKSEVRELGEGENLSVETETKREMEERMGEAVNRLIEIVAKRKVGEGGEKIDLLVKSAPK